MTIRSPKAASMLSLSQASSAPRRENIAAIVFPSDPATYTTRTASCFRCNKDDNDDSSSSCSDSCCSNGGGWRELILSYETETDLRSQLYNLYLNDNCFPCTPQPQPPQQSQGQEKASASRIPKFKRRSRRTRSQGLVAVVEEATKELEEEDGADDAGEEFRFTLSRDETVRFKNQDKTDTPKIPATIVTGGTATHEIAVIPDPPARVAEPTSRDLDSRQKLRWRRRKLLNIRQTEAQPVSTATRSESNSPTRATTTPRFMLTRPRLFRHPSSE